MSSQWDVIFLLFAPSKSSCVRRQRNRKFLAVLLFFKVSDGHDTALRAAWLVGSSVRASPSPQIFFQIRASNIRVTCASFFLDSFSQYPTQGDSGYWEKPSRGFSQFSPFPNYVLQRGKRRRIYKKFTFAYCSAKGFAVIPLWLFYGDAEYSLTS